MTADEMAKGTGARLAAKLALIGTEGCALRASSLPELMRCPWTWVAKMFAIAEDSAGAAADTGSAVHHAAAVWHDTKDVAAAVSSMKANLNKFPFANVESAAEQFFLYSKDPRNSGPIILCEKEVRLSLPAHETDKTQAPILIVGHLDQVRRVNGRLAVYDIKTGSPEGPEMLANHAYQLAAYQLAAAVLCGEIVPGAWVIRTKDYLKKKPGPVFWQAPWSHRQLGVFTDAIRRRVAAIRNGDIDAIPGESCRWCPFGNVGACTERLIELGGVK
jgi:hypothetical protein